MTHAVQLWPIQNWTAPSGHLQLSQSLPKCRVDLGPCTRRWQSKMLFPGGTNLLRMTDAFHAENIEDNVGVWKSMWNFVGSTHLRWSGEIRDHPTSLFLAMKMQKKSHRLPITPAKAQIQQHNKRCTSSLFTSLSITGQNETSSPSGTAIESELIVLSYEVA